MSLFMPLISLNKMVYDSGSSMRGYSLQDYSSPSIFGEMDLVKVVTLTFTAREFLKH